MIVSRQLRTQTYQRGEKKTWRIDMRPGMLQLRSGRHGGKVNQRQELKRCCLLGRRARS